MQITHDLAIGGLQQVVVNLCRHIDRDRFHVSVLCLRNLGEFVPEIEKMGINVYCVPQKKHTDYFSFLKVARLLRREKTEVIHTHNTQPFVDGTLASLMSGVRRIVHTDHGRGFPDKRRYMVAEWAMSLFADKIVGVSPQTTASLRTFEKIPRKKLMTIENGISGSSYTVPVNRDGKLKELGIGQKGPIIGIVARLSREKGVTHLLKAMPNVARHIPGVALVVAGTGEVASELKAEALALGIEGNVYFLGPRMDVPELLGLFDLMVLPSLREGLPMVVPEAMAAGCPVLATEVGGVPTMITHGVNGSLVAPGQPEQIASEAIRLLQDPSKLALYRDNGKRFFKNHFNAASMTRSYERLYRR